MEEKVLLQHLAIYRNEIWSITNSILDQRDKLLKTYYMVNDSLEKECINLKLLFTESEKIQLKLKQYIDKFFPEDAPERLGPVGVYLPIKNE